MGRRASSQSQTGNIQIGFGGYWILPLLLLPRVEKSGKELMGREIFSVSRIFSEGQSKIEKERLTRGLSKIKKAAQISCESGEKSGN